MKASENTHPLPPFPAFPCVSRYVAVGATAEAADRVRRSIKSSDGVSLVIGPPGTGKSLLCRLLADEFADSHDVVFLGDSPIDDKIDFHRHLLHRLSVDGDGVVDGDFHLALIDYVGSKKAAKDGLLIIVDEAQCLSAEVLEAIRMVTNIMHNDVPRVKAVVCGGVNLDDTLAAPSLDAFTQRVSTRCYLHPLNTAETRQYVCHAIQACDSDPEETISDEAIAAIHHACSGVPRLINQIMTEAIDCAAENDQDYICEKMIDLAWAQLQQLPSPMVEEPKIAHNTTPVEFGALSDIDAPSQHQADAPSQHQPDAPSQHQPDAPSQHQPDAPSQHQADAPSQHQLDVSEQASEPAKDDVVEDQGGLPASVEMLTEEPCSDDCQLCNDADQWAAESAEQACLSVAPESIRDVPAAQPLPAALFGEFEIEESIPISDSVRSETTTQNDPPAELEAMIHSEIVSLSELASDARFACTDAESQEIVSLDNTPQPVLWIDEPESDAANEPTEVAADDITLAKGSGSSDDSDLLIIEEDIDVAPLPMVSRVDSEEQAVTVDFHAMLSSMRSKSNQ